MKLIAEIEARAGVGVDPSIADVRPPDFWLTKPTGPCVACNGTKEIPIELDGDIIAVARCEAC